MNSPNAKYLQYVLRHKWFVFTAGLKTKAPLWRLLVHDWSKFTRAEWRGYVDFFYGGEKTPEVREAFDQAWLHHQHVNKHHWQYWVLKKDDGTLKPLRMPEKIIREMVADWMGAGRAITGKWEVQSWYAANRNKMVLHEEARRTVEKLLDE